MRLTALCVVVMVALSPTTVSAHTDHHAADTLLTPEGWANFSANLSKALESENRGVVTGALDQIIRYGDYLHFPQLTVFHVMRIARDDKDPQVRRMAIIAAGNMHSRWAIEFFSMLAEHEKNKTLKETMEEVVSQYWSDHAT